MSIAPTRSELTLKKDESLNRYPLLQSGRGFRLPFMGGRPHRVLFFWHMAGNKFLTLLSNMFTDLNLTDMLTCYKAFKAPLIESIQIEEDRLAVEPEIVAKVAKLRDGIFEVGISYYGRTYEEGKKIGWRDGFGALRAIIKYGCRR